MSCHTTQSAHVSRRQALVGTAATVLSLASACRPTALQQVTAHEDKPIMQVGLITDIHHADVPARGSRHYRDSLAKLDIALNAFRQRGIDALVQLGDLVDGHESVEADERATQQVIARIRQADTNVHLAMGNHCLQQMSKNRFAQLTGGKDRHYHFDLGPLRFIILDPNFNPDGTAYDTGNFRWNECFIPPQQLDWLGDTLAATDKPTIVLSHQRLDDAGNYAAVNHAQVRKIIAEAGGKNVKAVLQGHSHQNHRQMIDGIAYIVLRAVIEGPGAKENHAYSILNAYDGGALTLEIQGYGRQVDQSIL